MALTLLLKAVIFVTLNKMVFTLQVRNTVVLPFEEFTTCENGWLHKGNYCYQMESHPMTWHRAVTHCVKNGGNLTSILSKEQQDFLTENFVQKVSSGLWIGLHDIDKESEYKWEDGSRFNYTNWDRREPSGFRSKEEDCVEMRHDVTPIGSWNDVSCNFERPFICQKQSQKEVYTNEENINSCSGSLSVRISAITITFAVVMMVMMGGIFYYRRLWMKEISENVESVVFKSENTHSELSIEVEEENCYSGGKMKYARL